MVAFYVSATRGRFQEMVLERMVSRVLFASALRRHDAEAFGASVVTWPPHP